MDNIPEGGQCLWPRGWVQPCQCFGVSIGGTRANHAGFELLAKSLHLEFLTVCNHKPNLYICLSFTKQMQVHSSIAMYWNMHLSSHQSYSWSGKNHMMLFAGWQSSHTKFFVSVIFILFIKESKKHHLKIWRSCWSSESPGKRGALRANSAVNQNHKKRNQKIR